MCRYYLTYRFQSKRLQSRRQFSYGGKCGLRGQSGLELRCFSMLKLTTTIVPGVRCQVITNSMPEVTVNFFSLDVALRW